jgi:4'-phosphopantetheinyl transferase EntD
MVQMGIAPHKMRQSALRDADGPASLLEGLFDPPIVSCAVDIHEGLTAHMFPEEIQSVAAANETRRREFAAGRYCARLAMRSLGLPEVPVPVGYDRAPLLPQGIVGSISHSKTRCVAAVAWRSDTIKAIGIDIEELEPLDDALVTEVCVEQEEVWLSDQPLAIRGLLAKVIFSAKESTYKCQYQLSRMIVGFDALYIELDVQAGLYTAQFAADIAPFKKGDRLRGRLRLADRHIVTAMTLT